MTPHEIKTELQVLTAALETLIRVTAALDVLIVRARQLSERTDSSRPGAKDRMHDRDGESEGNVDRGQAVAVGAGS